MWEDILWPDWGPTLAGCDCSLYAMTEYDFLRECSQIYNLKYSNRFAIGVIVVCIFALFCSVCCCVREVTAWKIYTQVYLHTMYIFSNQSLKCHVFSPSVDNHRNWRAPIYFFNFKQAYILFAQYKDRKELRNLCIRTCIFIFCHWCMYNLRVYFLPFIIVKIVIILQIFTNIFRLVIQASDKLL